MVSKVQCIGQVDNIQCPDRDIKNNQEMHDLSKIQQVAQEHMEIAIPLLGEINAEKPTDYILELDIPRLGTLKIVPFYKDKDKDDKDDSDTRIPLGWKENTSFAACMVGITLFSGYFYNTPFVSAAIAGGTLDISKKWYNYTKKLPALRNSARVVAAALLVATIAFQYMQSDELKSHAMGKIIASLPGVYPALAFIKAELGDAHLPEKVIALAHKCGLTISKETAEAIAAGAMALPSLAVSLTTIDQNLSAAGGVFLKTNMRVLSDVVGKSIKKLETPFLRIAAGGAMAANTAAAYTFALIGNSLGWFSNILGKAASDVLIVPSSDIASRTIKASIKADIKQKKKEKNRQNTPEQTCAEKWQKNAGKIASAVITTLPIVASSAVVGQFVDPTSNTAQNSGVVAALFGDLVSFSKVATKKYDKRIVAAASVLGVGASAALYGFTEFGKVAVPKALYSSSLIFGSLAAAYAIYHFKRIVRPPKIEKPTVELVQPVQSANVKQSDPESLLLSVPDSSGSLLLSDLEAQKENQKEPDPNALSLAVTKESTDQDNDRLFFEEHDAFS